MDFPMWGSDTGDYFAPARQDKELLARWLELSAFSPMMEVILGPQRTVWDDYDDELVKIAKTYVASHHDLIPYTRSNMYRATQTGMPILRALIFAYPDNEKLSDIWDEYLYGDDILVAPVTMANATERGVLLPAGRWLNYNDKHTVYEGNATITAAAPIGTIPVFVRAGAVIPRGDIVQLNNNWDAAWAPKLRIEVFPSAKQSNHFDYFTGSAVQRITVASERGALTIQFGDLGVNGELEVHCRSAKAMTKNGVNLRAGVDYRIDAQAQTLTIPFQGAITLAIQGVDDLF